MNQPDRWGCCVWLTGLPASGKSTIATVLERLLVMGGRTVTLLDGDVIRRHLSQELGFSKEDRDTNVRRVGFVAAEIVRHQGVAICALVSPYHRTRQEVRRMVGQDQFILIFVDTPLEVCERRDPKGMYAQARRGQRKQFTGVDDPYEVPGDAALTLNTINQSPEDNARQILEYLAQRGFMAKDMLCR